MNTTHVAFCFAMVTMLGCTVPVGGDADHEGVDVVADGSASITGRPASYVPTVAPCGLPSQYNNVPLTLNDGSGTVVPTGGIVPAGNGATFPVLAPMGSVITSIKVRIDPAAHTSLNGQFLPYLELHRMGRNGVETTIGAIAWDPNWNGSTWNPSPEAAASFSGVHDITMTLNETVGDAYYYATFAQEWGGGQAQDGVVCGTVTTHADPAQ